MFQFIFITIVIIWKPQSKQILIKNISIGPESRRNYEFSFRLLFLPSLASAPLPVPRSSFFKNVY